MLELKPMWKGPMDGTLVLGLVRRAMGCTDNKPRWHWTKLHNGVWTACGSDGDIYPHNNPYIEHPMGWITYDEYRKYNPFAGHIRDYYARIVCNE